MLSLVAGLYSQTVGYLGTPREKIFLSEIGTWAGTNPEEESNSPALHSVTGLSHLGERRFSPARRIASKLAELLGDALVEILLAVVACSVAGLVIAGVVWEWNRHPAATLFAGSAMACSVGHGVWSLRPEAIRARIAASSGPARQYHQPPCAGPNGVCRPLPAVTIAFTRTLKVCVVDRHRKMVRHRHSKRAHIAAVRAAPLAGPNDQR
jgi:hypothetical protein